MNKRKLAEMRERLDSELSFEASELRKELFELRFKASAEGLANPSRIRTIRRQIARIATLLNERHQGVRGSRVKV